MNQVKNRPGESMKTIFKMRDIEGKKHDISGVGFEYDGVAYFFYRHRKGLYNICHADTGAGVCGYSGKKPTVEQAQEMVSKVMERVGRVKFYAAIERAKVAA